MIWCQNKKIELSVTKKLPVAFFLFIVSSLGFAKVEVDSANNQNAAELQKKLLLAETKARDEVRKRQDLTQKNRKLEEALEENREDEQRSNATDRNNASNQNAQGNSQGLANGQPAVPRAASAIKKASAAFSESIRT